MSSFKIYKVYKSNGVELVLEAVYPKWRNYIRISQAKVISLRKPAAGVWNPYPCYRYKHAIMDMLNRRKKLGRTMMQFQGLEE